MRKALFLLSLALSLSLFGVANAQQDCQEVDCIGMCGRFIDENGDGFCDHGQISEANRTLEEEVETNHNKILIISFVLLGVVAIGSTTALLMRKKKK